jgi:hypothetical protein
MAARYAFEAVQQIIVYPLPCMLGVDFAVNDAFGLLGICDHRDTAMRAIERPRGYAIVVYRSNRAGTPAKVAVGFRCWPMSTGSFVSGFLFFGAEVSECRGTSQISSSS